MDTTDTTTSPAETQDTPATLEDLLAARDAFITVAKRYKGEFCFATIIEDGENTRIDANTTNGDFANLRHRVSWMACAGHIRAAAHVFDDERCRKSGLEALHDTTSRAYTLRDFLVKATDNTDKDGKEGEV